VLSYIEYRFGVVYDFFVVVSRTFDVCLGDLKSLSELGDGWRSSSSEFVCILVFLIMIGGTLRSFVMFRFEELGVEFIM